MSGRMVGSETIVTLEDRVFRGPTCVGVAASQRYATLRRLLRDARDVARVPPEPPRPEDPNDPEAKARYEAASEAWRVLSSAEVLDVLATQEETWRVVDETLVGWSMDTPDGPIDLNRSTIFRGWPAGRLQVATNAWAAEGFLSPPGMHHPPAVGAERSPSVTPEPSTLPAGRAV